MKKALVIVSFGTTYERARRSIDAVECALAQAAEGYDVFRAYTSSIVRKVLKSRGEIVPSLEEALEKLANESYDTVFVQPTHLLCGNEYDEKIRAPYMRYVGRFLRGGIGKPLIANNDDLLKLAEILAALKPDDADALLLMGHGTTHFANMVYPAMQTALRLQGPSQCRRRNGRGLADAGKRHRRAACAGRKAHRAAPDDACRGRPRTKRYGGR